MVGRTVLLAMAGLLALTLNGCGDGGSSHGGPHRVAVARPKAPVWCPTGGGPPVAGQSQPNHPAGGSFDTRILLGMGEAPASAKVRQEGCVVRVIARDGQRSPLTADYRRNRVNLTIEHGHVTSVGVY